ncbi:MAG: TIGR03663 family protein, partial [SAR202 cluster bacterium]|nr:TIGR03663 family protein [SAR202 cluster bacterium]
MVAINLNYKIISYSLLAFLGVLVRFIDLSNRAVHHDESLHGYFSFITSQGDYYNHNPLTHGMFLFNVLSSSFWLITDNDFILRLPFALSGVVLIFVPLLLKKEIGFLPCFIFSLLVTFSPSIAYFSRFARNDIFMALTLLILVIAIFKYIKTSKIIWIYVSVAFLSLGYTIKESMYINVFGILIFLFLYSFTDIKNIILGKLNIKNISNETRIFIIIFSLSLPLAAPLFSIFQSSLGFTLATPDGYPGVPPGLPTGLGIVISWIISFSLLGISIFIGIYSDKKIYIYSFLIFLVVYISMFTTFMIAPQGLVTGQWQSLGYWLAQHEVARGSQPYYYYLLILFTNEFLPFLFGIPLS